MAPETEVANEENRAPDVAEIEAQEDSAEAGTSDTPPEGDEAAAWKARARKWEMLAKKGENAKARKAAEEVERLQKALAEHEEASKSEQEKALDRARKEAAEAATAEVANTYRAKIKTAEIRAQAAGRFADPSDAVALAKIDDDELFDSAGEINTDAIKTALDALIESKPHLAARQGGGHVQGDVDAGKGVGDAKSLEDLSVEEHLRIIQKR